MYKIEFFPKYKDTVVSPFMEGKYSKIDQNYVNRFFSPYVFNGEELVPSYNYMILTKSPILKQMWEDAIGVELDEEAEVWSKPEIDDEETYK